MKPYIFPVYCVWIAPSLFSDWIIYLLIIYDFCTNWKTKYASRLGIQSPVPFPLFRIWSQILKGYMEES